MIKKKLQSLVPENFKLFIKEIAGVPSQKASFKHIRNLGFQPKQCLDIGAYEGYWTREFKTIFPDCSVFMIEGQLEKEAALIKTKNIYEDVDYKITLLGANTQTVTFNKYETASSILSEHNITNAEIETRQLTLLDDITKQKNYRPDFIKIDTQGYELEILKGGTETLSTAEFVLLEVSFLDIYINCPLITDVLAYMQIQGFVVYDICTLMKRPLDMALYQADMLFVKENSSFRNNKRWV